MSNYLIQFKSTADAVELGKKYGIRVVPSIVVDGKLNFEGTQLLKKLKK